VREGWGQRRPAAVRAWGAAELWLGSSGPVVAGLSALVAEQPLVEPLVALLMRALHADGRIVEALQQFAATRSRLAEELGADPPTQTPTPPPTRAGVGRHRP